MTKAESQLATDGANRQAARAMFDARLSQVRADLEARSVGGRIADKALDETRTALGEAAAIARESKGVIAATLGALLLWAFRGPLLDAVLGWLGDEQKGGKDKAEDHGDGEPGDCSRVDQEEPQAAQETFR